jgi:hypothetical protein
VVVRAAARAVTGTSFPPPSSQLQLLESMGVPGSRGLVPPAGFFGPS